MAVLARVFLGLVVVVGPEAARAQLQAGAAAVELALPGGLPLAGYSARRSALPDVLGQYEYAHYFPPCAGKRDGEEIRAKALVLERSGAKLVFVSLDVVGVDAPLRGLITSQLALPPLSIPAEGVMISATHTHSGPGALSANHFLEYAATDRIHPAFRTSFASQVAAVVNTAATSLAPAELVHVTADAPGLHTNRSRDAGHGDHRLSVLAVRNKSTGAWIGALVNFAVHGTAHRDGNDRLSADFPGAMERAFAKAMGAAAPGTFPVLFLNGAEGDVIPSSKPASMQFDLDNFAAAQWSAWMSPAPSPLPDVEWKIEALDVPLGRPFMYLRSELKPFQEVFPFSRLGIELQTYFPTVARIWSISLAALRFMSIPGEPTTDVGLELRKAADEIGITSVWILGLTNDHIGYFSSRADWKVAEYESGSSVYGAYGSRRLVNGHLHLLRP
jgi:neutral ceramidase